MTQPHRRADFLLGPLLTYSFVVITGTKYTDALPLQSSQGARLLISCHFSAVFVVNSHRTPPPDHLGGAGGYVTEGSSGIQHFELSDWRPGVCRSNQIDRRRHVSFAAPLSPTGHLLSATWPQNRYTPRLTLTLNFQKHRAGISYSTAQIVLRMTKLSS